MLFQNISEFSEIVILKHLSRAVNVNHSEFMCTLFNDAASNSEDTALSTEQEAVDA
jgi:hypothetical protein